MLRSTPPLPLPRAVLTVFTADAFDFSFQVASPPGVSGSLRVVSGGTGCDDYETDLSGLVSVESTGGWDLFAPQLM